MKRYHFLILAIFFNASLFCDRVQYYSDNPITFDSTRILAHKGGGSFDYGNTFEGCKLGFESLDGIECDIQKSSDNSLWLSHSSDVSGCGSFKGSCFASLTSQTIIQIDSCSGYQRRYAQLEDVFKFMSSNYPYKFISLDVKAWTPCDILGVNMTKEMDRLAQKIIDLTLQYHLENKVMVESETGDFLYYIKNHTNVVETYLTAFGDFELGASKTLDAGFSGISFKYKFKEPLDKKQVDLLHRKGLKIQLWTVDDTNDIKEALSLKPDFIQTDLLEYKKN